TKYGVQRMGRQLAQNHVVALEVRQKKKPQRPLAFLGRQAIRREENPGQEAKAERHATQENENALACTAVFLGDVRLIDNMELFS
ncbi:MAG: hypothetical protein ABSE72_05785, partial [Bacteroidales bacterium]